MTPVGSSEEYQDPGTEVPESTDTSLGQQLAATREYLFREIFPPRAVVAFQEFHKEMAGAGKLEAVLKPGDRLPSFTLLNAQEQERSVEEFLARGPVVIVFFRGRWCSFCSLQLIALERYRPMFEALGASLLAISPQLPRFGLEAVQTDGLSYEVLSDIGNVVARRFGLAYSLPGWMVRFYEEFGLSLSLYNGDDRNELPLPGTFVVNPEGIITKSFVHLDHTRRAEPELILEALREQMHQK
jgi:peroxiredoxin